MSLRQDHVKQARIIGQSYYFDIFRFSSPLENYSLIEGKRITL
jgi:hypothetical protein